MSPEERAADILLLAGPDLVRIERLIADAIREAAEQGAAAERAAATQAIEQLIEGHRQREAEARRRHGRFSPHENEHQLQHRALQRKKRYRRLLSSNHPLVREYLTAFRSLQPVQGDDVHATLACAFTDHLPEETADAAGLADLCWLLAGCEDEDVEGVKGALAAWDESHGQGERAEVVRKHFVVRFTLGSERQVTGWACVWPDEEKPGTEAYRETDGEACHSRWIATRKLRRCVLALYPEVTVVLQSREMKGFGGTLPAGQRQQTSDREVRFDSLAAQAGCAVVSRCQLFWVCDENRRCFLEQHIAAPDLIPPEPALTPAAYQAPEDFDDPPPELRPARTVELQTEGEWIPDDHHTIRADRDVIVPELQPGEAWTIENISSQPILVSGGLNPRGQYTVLSSGQTLTLTRHLPQTVLLPAPG